MADMLGAGVARVIINPPLGIKRPGIRLFSEPIQAIDADLTATALVFSNENSKVVILACDVLQISLPVTFEVRRRAHRAPSRAG